MVSNATSVVADSPIAGLTTLISSLPWGRLHLPIFLLILGLVFLALLLISLRGRRPTRWKSLTARSFTLSLIIHAIVLSLFGSVVITRETLRKPRDPEFQVILDSENLLEEKISLGIREEVSELPLANSSVVMAPQQAEMPMPQAARPERVSPIAPGRIDLAAFDVRAEVAEPKPAKQEPAPATLGGQPVGDFKVTLPELSLEVPKPPSVPQQTEPTASPGLLSRLTPEQPLAERPAPESVAPPAAARVPTPGPGSPLTASIVRLPAPAGVRSGESREPATPPRALAPSPLPRIVPPPLTLEERPEIEEPYRARRPEARAKIIEEMGGTTQTEQAVQIALAWLARHQSDDGRWDIEGFDAKCGKCGGAGEYGKQDAAATGLAVLAFLGANHTHKSAGPYRDNLARAIAWLVKQERPNGDLRGGGNMYDQGIATIALAEAYGMTRDPQLRPVAERAVRFIISAQHPETGGWRYFPNDPGDTSVFGWQVMALRSASMATIAVPSKSFALAEGWLNRVGGGKHGGLYGYQSKQPGPAMAAEGMFARQLLGHSPDEPMMIETAEYLRKRLPDAKEPNMYYWYYGTLALFQQQGEAWTEWNRAMRRALLSLQDKSGAPAGSWAPRGQWARAGGRVVETAMATLCLEVYYRYLPLYTTHTTAKSLSEDPAAQSLTPRFIAGMRDGRTPSATVSTVSGLGSAQINR